MDKANWSHYGEVHPYKAINAWRLELPQLPVGFNSQPPKQPHGSPWVVRWVMRGEAARSGQRWLVIDDLTMVMNQATITKLLGPKW